LIKRLLYFVSSLVIILLLGLVVSPNKSTQFLYENVSASEVLVVKVHKSIVRHAVIVSTNQATNFNHFKQRSVEYKFVTELTIFLAFVIYYLRVKSIVLPPPWYIFLKHHSRISLSGWKVSNLLYKNKLFYQH